MNGRLSFDIDESFVGLRSSTTIAYSICATFATTTATVAAAAAATTAIYTPLSRFIAIVFLTVDVNCWLRHFLINLATLGAEAVVWTNVVRATVVPIVDIVIAVDAVVLGAELLQKWRNGLTSRLRRDFEMR